MYRGELLHHTYCLIEYSSFELISLLLIHHSFLDSPTSDPTAAPTAAPTSDPTVGPTAAPTGEPTELSCREVHSR